MAVPVSVRLESREEYFDFNYVVDFSGAPDTCLRKLLTRLSQIFAVPIEGVQIVENDGSQLAVENDSDLVKGILRAKNRLIIVAKGANSSEPGTNIKRPSAACSIQHLFTTRDAKRQDGSMVGSRQDSGDPGYLLRDDNVMKSGESVEQSSSDYNDEVVNMKLESPENGDRISDPAMGMAELGVGFPRADYIDPAFVEFVHDLKSKVKIEKNLSPKSEIPEVMDDKEICDHDGLGNATPVGITLEMNSSRRQDEKAIKSVRTKGSNAEVQVNNNQGSDATESGEVRNSSQLGNASSSAADHEDRSHSSKTDAVASRAKKSTTVNEHLERKTSSEHGRSTGKTVEESEGKEDKKIVDHQDVEPKSKAA